MPTTRDRVPRHTNEEINRKIKREMEERVRFFAGHPTSIGRRLQELDAEWDIERAIEFNAATLAFAGAAVGLATDDRRWFALPLLVTVFLFQHAVQGWCPPVPILRRLGFRTSYEIEQERQALKALRGDFSAVETAADKAGSALAAAYT